MILHHDYCYGFVYILFLYKDIHTMYTENIKCVNYNEMRMHDLSQKVTFALCRPTFTSS